MRHADTLHKERDQRDFSSQGRFDFNSHKSLGSSIKRPSEGTGPAHRAPITQMKTPQASIVELRAEVASCLIKSTSLKTASRPKVKVRSSYSLPTMSAESALR